MKYKFLPFVESGKSISGGMMLKKAEEMGCNTGKEDVDYLLGHQDEIPKEERKHYIIFPKYTDCDSDGGLRVACLGFGGGRWFLNFFWLDGGWNGGDRLALSDGQNKNITITNNDKKELIELAKSEIRLWQEFLKKIE